MMPASTSVSPAFRRPYTTTYMPIEKKTMFQGAPLITSLVCTAGLFLAMNRKNIAVSPVTADTGMSRNSLTKYPTSRSSSTNHDNLNIAGSLIASAGARSIELSKLPAILLR
ncbi:hypothetical protein D3C73_1100660 [compost metagenome]